MGFDSINLRELNKVTSWTPVLTYPGGSVTTQNIELAQFTRIGALMWILFRVNPMLSGAQPFIEMTLPENIQSRSQAATLAIVNGNDNGTYFYCPVLMPSSATNKVNLYRSPNLSTNFSGASTRIEGQFLVELLLP